MIIGFYFILFEKQDHWYSFFFSFFEKKIIGINITICTNVLQLISVSIKKIVTWEVNEQHL